MQLEERPSKRQGRAREGGGRASTLAEMAPHGLGPLAAQQAASLNTGQN